jgi:putative membrane protein insertion efficiency factor
MRSVRGEESAPLSGAQRAALFALRGYKLLMSPYFGGACRYVPSCSEYAAEAIVVHGVVKGSVLALRRLSRCHPLGNHGLDVVPRRKPQL